MMANKWVQAGLLLGMAIGFFFGGIASAFDPLAPIFGAVVVGLASLWISANARGTDGW